MQFLKPVKYELHVHARPAFGHRQLLYTFLQARQVYFLPRNSYPEIAQIELGCAGTGKPFLCQSCSARNMGQDAKFLTHEASAESLFRPRVGMNN